MPLRVQANNEEPSRRRLTSPPLNSRNKQSGVAETWSRRGRDEEAVILTGGSCLNRNQNKDSNSGQLPVAAHWFKISPH